MDRWGGRGSRSTCDESAATPLPGYAELHCLSNFSFLKGASHPEELVARAVELGYAALAITDECSLAGVVRAHGEAKDSGLKLIVGSSVVLDDGLQLVLLATSLHGYGNLSELITLGRMRCEKGTYRLGPAPTSTAVRSRPTASPRPAGTIDHLAHLRDCLVLWVAAAATRATPRSNPMQRWVRSTFGRADPTTHASRARGSRSSARTTDGRRDWSRRAA